MCHGRFARKTPEILSVHFKEIHPMNVFICLSGLVNDIYPRRLNTKGNLTIEIFVLSTDVNRNVRVWNININPDHTRVGHHSECFFFNKYLRH